MAHRPMLNMTTKALVQRIVEGDRIAVEEGIIRMRYGVRAKNEKLLVPALAPYVSEPIATTVAPVPVTVPAPVEERTYTAAEVALLLAQVTGAPAPVAAPAPVVTPSVTPDTPEAPKAPRTKSPATAFAERVKAIAPEGDRIRLAVRASRLAKQDNLAVEDFDGLTDEEILAVVSGPIKADDTLLDLLVARAGLD